MPDQNAERRLSFVEKLCYGVGHVLNDFTASMWFSYLLIYLHRVANFKSTSAGYMLLIGQVADAISTILVGFLSDRTKNGFCNYGKRKSWHLLGVICVLLGFPFSFNLCIPCENQSLTSADSELTKFVYYIPFVVLFQFGWASSQISHLALIPELSRNETERVSLNSIRYAFTVISSLFVYTVTYFSLRLNTTTTTATSMRMTMTTTTTSIVDASTASHALTQADSPKFMYLSLIVSVVGLLFQVVFHLGTTEIAAKAKGSSFGQRVVSALVSSSSNDEKPVSAISSSTVSSKSDAIDLKYEWLAYLKNTRFYTVGVLYMSTRLVINMCQVYVPMYLTDSIDLNKQSIALIPFICYLSGFISTFPLTCLTKLLGTYRTCFFGICLIMTCCILFWYHELVYDKSINSIVASVILGVGSTVVSVTSLSIITEFIGDKTTSGAFVYGTMSFTDKISSGVAVVLLEEFSPCQMKVEATACKHFYFYIMSALPSLCSLVSIVALAVLYFDKSSNIIKNCQVDPMKNEEENQNVQKIPKI